ncbi:MAG: hypothetical protein WC729_13050 [Sphingomonas sp.]|jgi:hypothetical protein|uniref:hypothetical protein n=1 Tax=Sphingomonas sp. TaxID=28214 RepID=UPI0035630E17
MRPLSHDEIGLVSGGDDFSQWVHDQQVATFLWSMEVTGSRGSSSEQPVPPPWWGDPESERWQEYVRNHYSG